MWRPIVSTRKLVLAAMPILSAVVLLGIFPHAKAFDMPEEPQGLTILIIPVCIDPAGEVRIPAGPLVDCRASETAYYWETYGPGRRRDYPETPDGCAGLLGEQEQQKPTDPTSLEESWSGLDSPLVVDKLGTVVGVHLGGHFVLVTIGKSRFIATLGPQGFTWFSGPLYYQTVDCSDDPFITPEPPIPPETNSFYPRTTFLRWIAAVKGNVGFYDSRETKTITILARESATQGCVPDSFEHPVTAVLNKAATVDLSIFKPPFWIKR